MAFQWYNNKKATCRNKWLNLKLTVYETKVNFYDYRHVIVCIDAT